MIFHCLELFVQLELCLFANYSSYNAWMFVVWTLYNFSHKWTSTALQPVFWLYPYSTFILYSILNLFIKLWFYMISWIFFWLTDWLVWGRMFICYQGWYVQLILRTVMSKKIIDCYHTNNYIMDLYNLVNYKHILSYILCNHFTRYTSSC